jgi:hypothetical protein
MLGTEFETARGVYTDTGEHRRFSGDERRRHGSGAAVGAWAKGTSQRSRQSFFDSIRDSIGAEYFSPITAGCRSYGACRNFAVAQL